MVGGGWWVLFCGEWCVVSGAGGRAPAVHVYLSSLCRALFPLTAPLLSSLFSALRSLVALSPLHMYV